MTNGLTRRDFLRASALAAAATAISGCTVNLQRTEYLESYVQPPEEGLPGENLWYATTCRQCSAGCGVIVRVSGGRARKIEGNPQHPVNRGKLCARGQAALQELYDPDRLQGAVRQVRRGSQQFEPLSWEDAVTRLVDKIRAAAPAAVAFFGGNLSTHLWRIVRRFSQSLGARSPLNYSLGDGLSGQGALVASAARLFGSADLPLFDVGRADTLFSFGANFLETWLSPVHYGRAYGQMRRGSFGKRGYLVQFEPRLSSTAACADEWVPLRPGTEGLVALGLGRIIVDEGLARDPQYAALFEQANLAEIAGSSGLPLEELEHLARLFAAAPQAVAVPGGSVAAHRSAAAGIDAVLALNLLTGRLGQPGGVYLPPAAVSEEFAPPPLSTYLDVRQLVDDMKSGRIEVLLVHGPNPAFELPPAGGFVEALANVPFVVSFSPAVDETAAQSDLILPDHANLESWGYHVPAIADRMVVSSQQPVMQPLYDTRATVDVLLAVARQIGASLGQELPWANEVEFIREAIGPFQDTGTSAEVHWAGWRRRGGHWAEADELRSPSATGSGQPLVLAQPAGEGDRQDYPFALHLYPSIALSDGRGANKSWLQDLPDPMTTVAWQTWVEVNPETAKGLGLEDGDLVRVISRAGTIEAQVYTFPGILEDAVAMPVGRGHEHYGRFAKGYGSNPMRLIVPVTDDVSGSLAWGETRVQIEPLGRRKTLARLESAAGAEYMREGH